MRIDYPAPTLDKTQETELRQLLPAITFDTITAPEQLLDVAAWRGKADNGLKKIAEIFDPQVKAADKAHKEAVALRAKFKAPYEQVKAICMSMMNAWEATQARIREEAERKRQEEVARITREAEEKAAREREAAAKVLAAARAAKDKIAAETARQNLEAARKAEQDVLSGNTAIELPPEPTLPAAPAIKGYSATKKWKADDTVNLGMLIMAAAKDASLMIYLTPDMKLINAMIAKSEGKALIPGVKAVSYFQSTQRGA